MPSQCAPLYKSHAPRCLADIAGQPEAVALLERLQKRNAIAGRGYWLAGKSGTGKTSLALLIAGMVASGSAEPLPQGQLDLCIQELDATLLTPAKLQELEECSAHGSLWGNGKAYLVNEAHGLRRDTVKQLLVTLDRLPESVAWIFTTTATGDLFAGLGSDCDALVSRCLRVPMRDKGLVGPFAARAKAIAEAEGLGGAPLEAYEFALAEHNCNLRAVLQLVEAGVFIR